MACMAKYMYTMWLTPAQKINGTSSFLDVFLAPLPLPYLESDYLGGGASDVPDPMYL